MDRAVVRTIEDRPLSLIHIFSLLTGFESFAVNLFIGGLMFIVGVIGYLVAVFKDKKGALVDPVSIDVEEEAASEA